MIAPIDNLCGKRRVIKLFLLRFEERGDGSADMGLLPNAAGFAGPGRSAPEVSVTMRPPLANAEGADVFTVLLV